MPNSIPYNHPSLVLGNIIDTKVLDVLKQINSAQSTIDAAQEKMNSFIAMKRSLAMTINELLDMNVDTSSLETKLISINSSITQAADAYITKRIDNEATIQKLKEELTQLELSDTIESPIDYEKSTLIHKPLSS
jgi:activator of 2-hydroxyglutaryl-CoA dehydratase